MKVTHTVNGDSWDLLIISNIHFFSFKKNICDKSGVPRRLMKLRAQVLPLIVRNETRRYA